MPTGTLKDKVDRAAAAYAGTVAIETTTQAVTIEELLDRAHRHARELPADGVPVVLLDERSVDTYAWYLAILGSGSAVVPANPLWPAARLQRICDSLGVRHVVSASHGVQQRDRSHEVAKVVDPATAYILHTSGSTGNPKGVPISEPNVDAFMTHVIDRYALGPGARLSATFELTFDLSVFDFFAAILSGAMMCLPDKREYMTPHLYVPSRGITHWFSVPSVVTTAARLGSLTPGCLPDLTTSIFCGEALTWAQVQAWEEAAPRSVIDNIYGPTELTLACAEFRVPEGTDSPRTAATVPIGAVYPHLEWRIGSERSNEELLVRGSQRFDGYVDPADNARAFEPSMSSSPVPVDHWYRTGDRVQEVDGVLVFAGRVDRQVKVRGMRIELPDVEGAFLAAPNVSAAACYVFTNSGLDRMGIALIGDGDTAAAREAARGLIPTYMMPSRLDWVDEFPLSENGKIDHRALGARAEGPA